MAKKDTTETSSKSKIETSGAEGITPGSDVEKGKATGGKFIVNGQYIKDLSFENPNMLRLAEPSAQPQQPEINLDLGVNVQSLREATYEVTLQVRINTKREEITGFILELSYAGVFTLTGWPAEHIEPLLFVEGPRLLFPYARSIVSAVTRDGGFAPLNLNPIDFTELYRRRLAQQAMQSAHAGEPAAIN